MKYTYILERNGDVVTDITTSGTIDNIKVLYQDGRFPKLICCFFISNNRFT